MKRYFESPLGKLIRASKPSAEEKAIVSTFWPTMRKYVHFVMYMVVSSISSPSLIRNIDCWDIDLWKFDEALTNSFASFCGDFQASTYFSISARLNSPFWITLKRLPEDMTNIYMSRHCCLKDSNKEPEKKELNPYSSFRRDGDKYICRHTY